MPRTKRVASRKLSESMVNIKPNKAQLDRATVQTYIKKFDKEVELLFVQLDEDFHRDYLELSTTLAEAAIHNRKDNDKTLSELRNEKGVENDNTRNITANSTRTVPRGRVRVRSSSSERSNANTTVKKPKKTRVSRSLSRQTKNNFTTPMTKQTGTSFGTVTPKLKPNVPQVILRRPKQGEIAISMQGSPLMVGSITSDRFPNINIPLQDGRMIAIQPERGLRFSELPEFDAITQRNLEMLRDNLNKVCGRNAMS